MSDDSLYDILGVSSEATSAQINDAYRKIVKSLHPDTSGTAATSTLFRIVHNAREVLSDPAQRDAYDRERLASDRVSSERSDTESSWQDRGAPTSDSTASGSRGFTPPEAVQTTSPEEALRAFPAAAQFISEVDADMLAEAAFLLRNQWGCGVISVGHLGNILKVLAQNIYRDAARPGFSSFRVRAVDTTAGPAGVEFASQFYEGRETRRYRIIIGVGDAGIMVGSADDTIINLDGGQAGSRPDRTESRREKKKRSIRIPGANLIGRTWNGWSHRTKLSVGVALAVALLALVSIPIVRSIPDGKTIASTAANGGALTPNGRRLYTLSSLTDVAAIDLSDGKVTTIPIPGAGRLWDPPVMNPNGRSVYVTDGARIAVIDSAADRVTSYIDPPNEDPRRAPFRPVLSPTGDQLYISSGAGIAAFNLQTKTYTPVEDGTDTGPIFSAQNSNSVAFFERADTSIRVFRRADPHFFVASIPLPPGFHAQAAVASPGGDRVYAAGKFFDDSHPPGRFSSTMLVTLDIATNKVSAVSSLNSREEDTFVTQGSYMSVSQDGRFLRLGFDRDGVGLVSEFDTSDGTLKQTFRAGSSFVTELIEDPGSKGFYVIADTRIALIGTS